MLNQRRYLLEFGGSMLAYAVILPACILFLNAHPDSSWRIPMALVPVIPLVLALIAVIRGIRRLDEMQRRIQLEAVAFAFCAGILGSISYGFLENVGFPPINWMWNGVGMIVLWGLALNFSRRRYS